MLLTATGAHAEGRGDARVVKTVVNSGKNVTVGTSKTVTFPLAIAVKDNSDVKGLTDVKHLQHVQRPRIRRLDRVLMREEEFHHVGVHSHDDRRSSLDPGHQ